MEKRMPKPGDMGFSIIKGALGFWVGLAQYLNGDGSKWSHVFVVLDDNTVMEAMPGGAKITPIEEYLGTAVFIDWGATDEQRKLIVEEAKKLVGTPYGFVDYFALALVRLNIRPNWLVKYIKNSQRLICSALADMVYNKAGITIFKDGRMWHDVTPGDLISRYIERDWLD